MPQPPPTSPPAPEPRPVGLRERKKVRTRQAIQSAALALIRRQGYEATTVTQIAAAAEVSPSTFFRYYPTKADVVLQDEFDPVLAAAFRRQPETLGLVAALRAAIAEGFSALSSAERVELSERTALIFTVPELRAAMFDQLAGAVVLLGELVAERTGRPVDDLAVRGFAGAVVGAMISVSLAIVDEPGADFVGLADTVLGMLEDGFAL